MNDVLMFHEDFHFSLLSKAKSKIKSATHETGMLEMPKMFII
jgi:hypothetical protein